MEKKIKENNVKIIESVINIMKSKKGISKIYLVNLLKSLGQNGGYTKKEKEFIFETLGNVVDMNYLSNKFKKSYKEDKPVYILAEVLYNNGGYGNFIKSLKEYYKAKNVNDGNKYIKEITIELIPIGNLTDAEINFKMTVLPLNILE